MFIKFLLLFQLVQAMNEENEKILLKKNRNENDSDEYEESNEDIEEDEGDNYYYTKKQMDTPLYGKNKKKTVICIFKCNKLINNYYYKYIIKKSFC